MSNWSNTATNLMRNSQNTFGEPVVYQPMQADQPGTPVTITAIRRTRERIAAGPVASVEEIDINPNDLAATPARGDLIQAWGAQFTVTSVRQSDPYGMIHVTMTMQPQ